MHKKIFSLFIAIILVGVLVNAGITHAAKTPETTVKIYIHSLDGYAVPKAYADLIYRIGNKTTGPVNFPATDNRGQSNITFPLNQTVNAKLNVTYLNVVVLENQNVTLNPNATQTFNLTVNIVNLTYSIMNPYGGLLNSSTITFKGLAGSNVSSISINEGTPKGSLLLPTGTYTVSAYRGPVFYHENITINYKNRVLNITAPLLTLNYVVMGVNGKQISAQAVNLLYSGSLVDSSNMSPGEFSGLLPGYYQLVVYGDGLTNSTTVGLGSNTTVYVVLPTGYDVSIKITSEFGTPLKGYNVTLAGPNSYSNITGSSGVASFEGVSQGEYFVEVYSHGQLVYATTTLIDSSGTQQLVLPSTPSVSNTYIIVRLAFGFVLIVLAALILLTSKTKAK